MRLIDKFDLNIEIYDEEGNTLFAGPILEIPYRILVKELISFDGTIIVVN